MAEHVDDLGAVVHAVGGDVGEDGAAAMVRSFVDAARDAEVIGWLAKAKVATDGQTVLVVYLDENVSEYKGPHATAVARAMKEWAGASEVRAGFSFMSGSPILAVLLRDET